MHGPILSAAAVLLTLGASQGSAQELKGAPAPMSLAEDQGTRLFSTGDLSGWVEEQHDFYKAAHPKTKTWSVRDGVAACDGSTGNCGFLRYEKKLSDFTLRLEYRTAKGCNSGVCIRSIPYTGNPETLPPRRATKSRSSMTRNSPLQRPQVARFTGRWRRG